VDGEIGALRRAAIDVMQGRRPLWLSTDQPPEPTQFQTPAIQPAPLQAPATNALPEPKQPPDVK
jgi:hypothetical protein